MKGIWNFIEKNRIVIDVKPKIIPIKLGSDNINVNINSSSDRCNKGLIKSKNHCIGNTIKLNFPKFLLNNRSLFNTRDLITPAVLLSFMLRLSLNEDGANSSDIIFGLITFL